MKAPRNFRLDCTNSVLVLPMFGRGAALRVIAGEACTELGCDPLHQPRRSWLGRWLRRPLSSRTQ
jgi:hypothetical protein